MTRKLKERIRDKEREWKDLATNGTSEKILLGKIAGRQEVLLEDVNYLRETSDKRFDVCGRRFAKRWQLNVAAAAILISLIIGFTLLIYHPDIQADVFHTVIRKAP